MLLTKKQQKEKTKDWPRIEGQRKDESKSDYIKRLFSNPPMSAVGNIPMGYEEKDWIN